MTVGKSGALAIRDRKFLLYQETSPKGWLQLGSSVKEPTGVAGGCCTSCCYRLGFAGRFRGCRQSTGVERLHRFELSRTAMCHSCVSAWATAMAYHVPSNDRKG